MPPPPEMSDNTTHGIRVGATAYYLPDESDPDNGVYFFGYRIVILNKNEYKVKLLTRHWDIIDANGNNRQVDGPGVVGEQPELVTDRGFKYSSFAKLPTPWGTMEGTYTLQRVDDDATQTQDNPTPIPDPFTVKIGRFWLISDPPESDHPEQ